MKKFGFKVILSALMIFITSFLNAQKTDDRVLLNIAGQDITAADFMYVYNKNNLNRNDQSPDAIKEYLELFINFRLKVRQAEDLGMDTLQSFKKELEGYRKQLAQPYFTDTAVSDHLLREAYERKKWDIRASHILFRVEKSASPEDTLAAYKKALAAYQRVTLGGEDFGKVAAEVSEDPSARDTEASQYRPARKGNKGDLGFFTVFDMVYPFESGAYNTPPGSVSLPVRTDFGYHLIKVTDKEPALGQVLVAHVFVAIPPNATTQDSVSKKQKIDAAYAKFMQGASFEDVVKEYSEDKGSAGNGGKLPWFGSNRMVPEFIIATRNLKDTGSVSAPFTTPFGYHIIKLVNRRPVGTFEEEEAGLKSRLEKDVRNKLSEESVINKIKKENGFKEYPKAKDAILATLDTTLAKGEWSVSKAAGLEKTVFTIGDEKYSQQDLANYIAQKQPRKTTDIPGFFNDTYDNFVKEKCMAYEDSRLEQLYPDFRMLVQEYHDGILLFDLTDKNVWSKAVKDTTGLAEFYAANPGKYMWGKRFYASLVTILKPANVNADDVRKMISSGKTAQEVLDSFNSDTTMNIMIETSKYSEGDSPIVDKVKWKSGLSPMMESTSGPCFVYGYEILEPEPKALQEARGLVTADYQTYLEEQWIKELRAKYPVTVHQDVLSTLK
jgi:peptidyl-prolyl cis-trans isomerase SurA